MNRLVGLGLILLLLAGCSTLNDPGNKTLGKVKLYKGPSLPDSEISILRGISEEEERDTSTAPSLITHQTIIVTKKVDDKCADGEPADGYLTYSWKENRRPPLDKGSIDYYLEPGHHTLFTHVTSWLRYSNGQEFGGTQAILPKYHLAYDFKKGCRYRVGTHFKILEGWWTTLPQITYTITVWLQQVNADGSVDVAQFAKIDPASFHC